MLRQYVRSYDRSGIIFPTDDGEGVSLYNATGAAIAKGAVLTMAYASNSGEPRYSAVANAATAFPVHQVVALEAIAAGAIGLFQLSGKCKALADGTTDIAAGDFLKAEATDNYVKDGAARTTESSAVALEVRTAAGDALIDVLLIGEQHTIT